MRSSIQKKESHNAGNYKIRWSISLLPIILFLIILAAGLLIPDTFNKVLDATVMFIMKDMGWFISLSTLFFVGFVIVIMFHPIGKIKLAGKSYTKDEAPLWIKFFCAEHMKYIDL